MPNHRALTICQPYAELIASGVKRVENRNWPTHYRGPILIHAGKSREWLDGAPAVNYVFGAIVASAKLVDCISIEDIEGDHVIRLTPTKRVSQAHPWIVDHAHTEGPYCWVLDDVRRLPEPIPAAGSLGIWTWRGDIPHA